MTRPTLPRFKFLRNKYSKRYNSIIKRACKRRLDGYSELHHITPKCLGGSDEKSNLVELTFREHFLAHWLLTKMVKGKDRRKMLMALYRMTHVGRTNKIVAGWQYEIARRAVRDSKLGSKKPGVHSEAFKRRLRKRMKGNAYNKGKKYGPRSVESIERMKASWTPERRAALIHRNQTLLPKLLRGKPRDPEAVEKTAAWHRGRKRSQETRDKMSAAAMARE